MKTTYTDRQIESPVASGRVHDEIDQGNGWFSLLIQTDPDQPMGSWEYFDFSPSDLRAARKAA